MSEPLDLDAIRARADAATEGPWEAFATTVAARVDTGCRGGCSGLPGVHETACGWEDVAGAADRDATFIAHARTDIPALLAEVERLRAQVAARPAPTVDAEACGCCGLVHGLPAEGGEVMTPKCSQLWGRPFGTREERARIRVRISEGTYDNLYGGIQWWRSVEQDPKGVSLTSMLPDGRHAPVLDVDRPVRVVAHGRGTLVTVDGDFNPKALVRPLEALVGAGMFVPVTLDLLAQQPPAGRWINRCRGWIGQVQLVFAAPVCAIGSKTPGHHHLLVQEAMEWGDAKDMVTRLGEAGIVDPRFARISGAGDFMYVNSTCTEFDAVP